MAGWIPQRKVLAGAVSIPVAPLIAWVFALAGVTIPEPLAATLAALLYGAIAYFVPSPKPQLVQGWTPGSGTHDA